MSRIVCSHLVPTDMECADCKLEWLGHENEKDAEIKRLRKALKFYADAKRYQYTGWQGDMDAPSVLSDAGHRARVALNGDT